MATSTTGSGKVIASSTSGWSGSHSVCPVLTRLKPMPAAMSPAETSLISFALVGVHLHQAADALLAPGGRVQHLVARC